MPLTKCPDCNSDVSTHASACPKCGCPVALPTLHAETAPASARTSAPPVPRLRNVIGTAIIGLGIVFLLARWASSDDTSTIADSSTNEAANRSYTLTTIQSSRAPVSAPMGTVHLATAMTSSTHNGKSKTQAALPKKDTEETRDYMVLTDNVPACPSEVEIKTLLSSASDKAAWPQAQEIGEEEGCIELSKGQHVFPLDTEMWSALIQVRPEGSPDTYWTDMLAVK